MIAIYLRVSTEKQDEAMQLTAIKRILTKEEFESATIFKDHGITGSISERPDYQKILTLLVSGKLDKIVCYEYSRVWRDLQEQNRIFKLLPIYNCKLQSATEGYMETIDDELKANVLGSVNQHARKQMMRRINDGIAEKKQKIKDGKDFWRGRGKDIKQRKLRGSPK